MKRFCTLPMRAHFPYGALGPAQIAGAGFDSRRAPSRPKGLKRLLLACNTATANGIDALAQRPLSAHHRIPSPR